jgi:hypothetical protein
MQITKYDRSEIENHIRKFLKEKDVSLLTAICIQCNIFHYLIKDNVISDRIKEIINDLKENEIESEHILRSILFFISLCEPLANKIKEIQEKK